MAIVPEHLADAYVAIARMNHYLVGLAERPTDDELAAAQQVLIARENDAAGRTMPHTAKVIGLALDLIEDEQRRRLAAASRAVGATS